MQNLKIMHGAKKAKIANRKFNAWLKKRKLLVLGREFNHSVQSGGWPDFVARNKNGRLEFYEVKSGKHRLDPHQLEILKIIRRLGKVYVMRLNEAMDKFIDETPSELK
ncbi:MAG: VRR-NUC domain-containing protein [Parcubacteria group bacterium]|nr:VRR-NUC domain-containing protein [Parcubacteria group bacterium]